MTPRPLVSIVMPTYNRSHLIGESIQSVLNQTYPEWELIVVDDGSDDNTGELVKGFNHGRIRYHFEEHSGSIAAIRNAGLRRAGGEYIAFLDSDDLWRSDKLEFQLDLLRHHPDGSFIISNGYVFGNETRSSPECEPLFVGSLFWPILEGKRFVYYTPSLILRKAVIQRIGVFDEGLSGDMEFFLRLSLNCTGIFTNQRLVGVRKHDQNTSKKYSIDRYHTIIKIVTNFYTQGALQQGQYQSLIRLYYYRMGLRYLTVSRPRDAARSFWRYIRIVPFHWKGWARLLQAILLSIRP